MIALVNAGGGAPNFLWMQLIEKDNSSRIQIALLIPYGGTSLFELSWY